MDKLEIKGLVESWRCKLELDVGRWRGEEEEGGCEKLRDKVSELN